MQGPHGVRLQDMVGVTDRGSLWRAHDTVLRVVEPRLCDEAFREALVRLRQRRYQRMLEITGEGWTGGHFYVSYAVAPPWQTLEERLAGPLEWPERVALAADVCRAVELWRSSPLRPLGLNLRNVVLMRHAGRWLPWLVPCPPVTRPTPRDLFGLDATALAPLAPELIRGTTTAAPDSYALGTLVAQVLGPVTGSHDDEGRVEAQARGVLLSSTGTRVPSFLHTTPQFQAVLRTVERYRHPHPQARPEGADDLLVALEAMVDLHGLAGALLPDRVIEVLRAMGDDPRIVPIAEHLSATADPALALRYLDLAVPIAPDDLDLRRTRASMRWQLGRFTDELLDDLARLARLGDRAQRLTALKRTAQVHLLRGNPADAAKALYAANQLAPGDLDVLLSYRRCWLELDRTAEADQTLTEALRRIGRMEDSQMLTTKEAQLWRSRFAERQH
ncbi:lipopolysaccharide assembly protein LapB [Nocardia sp. NRRL S-836]|uniref:tetratricopeptide repeat protein n=1 Tax=Nocardia sp. NRRL S-836 TaxID=1519492 RepID=UPI0006AE85B7|nr:tetratricopeptide repeat protein [Nocardia sp. NRRL S-836]KOV86717.1 hypothetical protein ADL03_08400 [Nocardia sp. NRRL S-836]